MADIMLWLMYITLFVAIIAVLVSATRSFWMDNKRIGEVKEDKEVKEAKKVKEVKEGKE